MRCTKGESEVSQRSRRSSATSFPLENTLWSRSAPSLWNSGWPPSCTCPVTISIVLHTLEGEQHSKRCHAVCAGGSQVSGAPNSMAHGHLLRTKAVPHPALCVLLHAVANPAIFLGPKDLYTDPAAQLGGP